MSRDTGVWMPMFWGDYLKATGHLSTEQHGAYLLLIAHYWTTGKPLCDDLNELANITKLSPTKWKNASRAVRELFLEKDGLLYHKRIEEELLKAKKTHAVRVKKGQKGAAARWGKTDAPGNGPGNAPGMSQAMLGDAPSPSPSPKKERKQEDGADAPRNGFAFEGKVVRLTEPDLELWRKRFSYLHDIEGLLTARDEFLAGVDPKERGNWFISTAQWLANRNERAAAEVHAPSHRPGL